MELKRLYAYEVFPQKHETTREQPKGGNITINAKLRRTLNRLITDNRLETQTPIAFQMTDGVGSSNAANVTRQRAARFRVRDRGVRQIARQRARFEVVGCDG